MIDEPTITQSAALHTAVIHLTVPRSQIREVMGAAIGEVLSVLGAQGVAPAGALFTYHLKMEPAVFDFEVGFPVAAPIQPSGRVRPGTLPARKVARTTYRGPYEGLAEAWGQFAAKLAARGLRPAPDLWESYVAGPESGSDATAWRTELNRPLLDP